MPVNDAAFRVRADGVDWLKTWFLNPTHSDKIPIGASSESLPLSPAMAKALVHPKIISDPGRIVHIDKVFACAV